MMLRPRVAVETELQEGIAEVLFASPLGSLLRQALNSERVQVEEVKPEVVVTPKLDFTVYGISLRQWFAHADEKTVDGIVDLATRILEEEVVREGAGLARYSQEFSNTLTLHGANLNQILDITAQTTGASHSTVRIVEKGAIQLVKENKQKFIALRQAHSDQHQSEAMQPPAEEKSERKEDTQPTVQIKLENVRTGNADLLERLIKLSNESSKIRGVIEDVKEKIAADKEAKEKARLEAEEKAKAEAEAKEKARLEAIARAKAAAEKHAAEEKRKQKEFEDMIQKKVSDKLTLEKSNLSKQITEIKEKMSIIERQFEKEQAQEIVKQKNREASLIAKTLFPFVTTIQGHINNLQSRLLIAQETRTAKVTALTHLKLLCESKNLERLNHLIQYIITAQINGAKWDDSQWIASDQYNCLIYPARVMYAQGSKVSETAQLIWDLNTAIERLNIDIPRLSSEFSAFKKQAKESLELEISKLKNEIEVLNSVLKQPETQWRTELESQVRTEIQEEERKVIEREHESRKAEEQRVAAERQALIARQAKETQLREQQRQDEEVQRQLAARRTELAAPPQATIFRPSSTSPTLLPLSSPNPFSLTFFSLDSMQREVETRFRQAQADGTFARMRSETDRLFQQAQQNGTFDGLRQMHW